MDSPHPSPKAHLGDYFASLWDQAGHASPDVFAFFEDHPDILPNFQADVIAIDQSERWQRGSPIPVEEYLDRCPEIASDQELKLQLIVQEFRNRQANGHAPVIDEFVARFPELQSALREVLEQMRWPQQPPESLSTFTGHGGPVETDTLLKRTTSVDPCPETLDLPERIGRYTIQKLLGKGGFGRVYLAHDEELRRLVAVKVPNPNRIACPEDVEAYLAEARIVASLDHPHLVPVYDVGRTPDGLCYTVSKFIDGTDLGSRSGTDRPSHLQAAEIVASVAEGLHYAHTKGLVHRDIKPGNILLDASHKAYVADFGLALKEEELGTGPEFAGTLPYMSPEQARGESHRVDGRSDIFSLGVVFYELLTGTRPFRGDSAQDLLGAISTLEPRPPRQRDDRIPKELERICLKSLSKRASERYTTAKDLADDLNHFLSERTPVAVEPRAQVRSSEAQPAKEGDTDNRPIKIVPKGLRSFDAHDADFFLELLPGPRDRDGLPDSIRFWKTRIEETDPDATFSVGLIYGPSGCGKSSLVKAGLLPRLSDQILTVYVEATADETEARLLHGLRKKCTTLSDKLGLKETLAALRKGQDVPGDKKVLIVLDQFEQWLHARRDEEHTELVEALRQCDGQHVQCLVMVRDDFWLAVSRFMLALEVDLAPGHNIALADLFDLDHARKVLAAFGTAYGRLSESMSDYITEQAAFLNEAIAGLAEDGKVVCVRLALFAEMMKGKSWSPATLKTVGGTQGVGVTFLEETFGSETANPKHRLHQKSGRAVLNALLPESGSDIKGQMKSYAGLLEASGYSQRPKEFADLIRILDSEIRLITPTDPEGVRADEDSGSRIETGKRYYQLTHDYLVPSLRDWLNRKQKETRRGRAELRLAERSALWNGKPENRHLPSLWEFLNIRLLTQKKTWTGPQRKMMGKSRRVHALRAGIVAAVIAVAVMTGVRIRQSVVERQNATRAEGIVNALLQADIAQVPAIVSSLEAYRTWTDPLLKSHFEEAQEGTPQRLKIALALLPVDKTKVEFLYNELLRAEPETIVVIRDSMLSHKGEVEERLWEVLAKPALGRDRQVLCAAAALAKYSPSDERWKEYQDEVADKLSGVSPFFIRYWVEALRPIQDRLVPPLCQISRDSVRDNTQRLNAANILTDYAAERPEVLFDLLADSEQFQFEPIFAKLAVHKDNVVALAERELAKQPAEEASEDDKGGLARRQANAAVALVKLGTPEKVWPLLKHSPDPRARSDFIHWLGPLGGEPQIIMHRFETEPDVTIRRALLLALGEFTEQELPVAQRLPLIDRLLTVFETDADAGLHSAAEWLLRKWGHEIPLNALEQERAKNTKQRDDLVAKIRRELDNANARPDPHWYVNGQGQAIVIIPGPLDFDIGSPPDEMDRQRTETDVERQTQKRIRGSYAIGAKEVTVQQFLRFRSNHVYNKQFAPDVNCPVNLVSWYDAAAYCNWLSLQDGFRQDQLCYLPNAGGEYAEGMRLVPNYDARQGYRLPTEAEWEYACRANTVTCRYYGETEELLEKYAWYTKNTLGRSMQPVGRLKPNDMGLFDMLGNAEEWVQSLYAPYTAGEDREDLGETKNRVNRTLRGGLFQNPAANMRSAYRDWDQPTNRYGMVGFRVARTVR